MAVLATQPNAPRMHVTVGTARFPLPPNITALHIHAPDGDQLPPRIVAGTAIVGDARTEPWCRITTHDPSGVWRISISPRQAPALWSKPAPSGSAPSVLRTGAASAAWIATRAYWSSDVMPGDWMLTLGATTYALSLPEIPALPKIWADGNATTAQWQWLHALRHRPVATTRPDAESPTQTRRPLDARQRAIAQWIYTAVVRDVLARHAAQRTDPHEKYEQGSGYFYLVLYNPVAKEPLHFEFLETTLHVDKRYGGTHLHYAEASLVHRPRKARDVYPYHQLVTFYFDLSQGRCYVAEAGRFWFSRAPQYANVEFLHDIPLAELEQLVLQAQTA